MWSILTIYEVITLISISQQSANLNDLSIIQMISSYLSVLTYGHSSKLKIFIRFDVFTIEAIFIVLLELFIFTYQLNLVYLSIIFRCISPFLLNHRWLIEIFKPVPLNVIQQLQVFTYTPFSINQFFLSLFQYF
jgi:hypothetical protein